MVNLTQLELIFRSPDILEQLNHCAELYQKRLDSIEDNEVYKKAVRVLRDYLNRTR